MDIEERQSKIVSMLSTEKTVKALSLSKKFEVSVETIRKDLMDLQEQGKVIRVHGGAKLQQGSQESAYERRHTVHAEAKTAIGSAAYNLIEDGQTIFLDYGTTTYALAKELLNSSLKLTVITNTLPIAQLLSGHKTIETVVLGGILRKNENSLYGPLAEQAISNLFLDQGFFGCAGISERAGVTNFHPMEVTTSKKAMSHCSKVIILADNAKFDEIAPQRVAGLEEITTVITNQKPRRELAQALEQAQTQLIVARSKNGI